MASSGKKKTTFAKLAREQKLRERRRDKQAKKEARKATGVIDPAQPRGAESVAADGYWCRVTPAGTFEPFTRPRLRGVLHQWAFAVSPVAGIGLVLEAASVQARLAVAVYALSVAALFGTSALYHRVDWRTVGARRLMRRLDHTMIFVLIAGTYTPVALLVLHGTTGMVMLIAVWSAALGGAVFKLVWMDAPGWLGAATYILIGWIAVIALPELVHRLGTPAVGVLALGGVLYSAGGVIYARKRPDLVPSVFGYHELFHLLVITAAALQYAVVAFWIVQSTRQHGSERGTARPACYARPRAMRLTPWRPGGLQRGVSDQDHVSGVECQVTSCLRLGEPRQLQDRTASRVENDPFHGLTSPSTRHRSPVTRIISVVEVVDGGWLSVELISQVGVRTRSALWPARGGTRPVGSAWMQEPIGPSDGRRTRSPMGVAVLRWRARAALPLVRFS